MYVQLGIWAASMVVNRLLTDMENDEKDKREAEAKLKAERDWRNSIDPAGTASAGSDIPIIFGRPVMPCNKVKGTGADTPYGNSYGISYEGENMYMQSSTYLISAKVDRVSKVYVDSGRGDGLTNTFGYTVSMPNVPKGYLASNELMPISDEDGNFTGQRMGQYPLVVSGYRQDQRLGQSSSVEDSRDIIIKSKGNIREVFGADAANFGDYSIDTTPSLGYTIFTDGMPDSESGPMPTGLEFSLSAVSSDSQVAFSTGTFSDPDIVDITKFTYYPTPVWTVQDHPIGSPDENTYTDLSRRKGLCMINIMEFNVVGDSKLESKFYVRTERQPDTGVNDVDKWVNTVQEELDELGKTYIPTDSIRGANPVAVAMECIVNADWGLGFPLEMVDTASFAVAAEVMYDEQIFMSMSAKREAIKNLLDDCATVGEFLIFTNRQDGKVSVRALRDQGTEDFTLDDSGITSITSYSVDDKAGLPGQVDVKFTDIAQRDSVTYTNKNNNGERSTFTLDIASVDDSAVADKILTRASKTLMARTARLQMNVSSSAAAGMNIGDVGLIGSAEFGIPNAYYRVLNIKEGKQESGTVSLTLVTDTWSRAALPYYKRTEEQLVDIVRAPKPSPNIYTTGTTFFELSLRTLKPGETSADIPPQNFGTVLAASPSAFSTKFALPDMASEDFDTEGLFSAQGELRTTLKVTDTELLMSDTNCVPKRFDVIYLGDEIIQIKSMVVVNGKPAFSLARGCHDTVPVEHVSGARFRTLRADGMQNWTSAFFLSPPIAPISSFRVQTVMDDKSKLLLKGIDYSSWNPIEGSRQFLPPTPTNVKVNGSWTPNTVSGNITLSWNHRQHEDDFQVKELTSFLSVDGTTGGNYYKVTFNLDNGNAIFSDTTTALGYVVLEANLIAANGGVAPTSIDLTIEGYDPSNDNLSWQKYEYSITYGAGTGQGWGFDWGNNWGD